MSTPADATYRRCSTCDVFTPLAAWTIRGSAQGEMRCPACTHIVHIDTCTLTHDPFAPVGSEAPPSVLDVYTKDPAAALPFVLLRTKRALENAYPDDAADLQHVLERAVATADKSAVNALLILAARAHVAMCRGYCGVASPSGETAHNQTCHEWQSAFDALCKRLV